MRQSTKREICSPLFLDLLHCRFISRNFRSVWGRSKAGRGKCALLVIIQDVLHLRFFEIFLGHKGFDFVKAGKREFENKLNVQDLLHYIYLHLLFIYFYFWIHGDLILPKTEEGNLQNHPLLCGFSHFFFWVSGIFMFSFLYQWGFDRVKAAILFIQCNFIFIDR